MLKHIFLAIAPTQPPLETSSDLRNDLRSDVTTTLPLLQQVASGYTLTTLASGQILLTPIANRTMVKPRRLQQQQLPSFSLSSPPTELTPQMHAGLLSTSSTPVHDFENQGLLDRVLPPLPSLFHHKTMTVHHLLREFRLVHFRRKNSSFLLLCRVLLHLPSLFHLKTMTVHLLLQEFRLVNFMRMTISLLLLCRVLLQIFFHKKSTAVSVT